MEFALLGWPEDDHRLRLDHRRFAYAGKFVMTSTGKAVVGDDGVVAAAAFDADRTDAETLCVRYVTVREDRQGERLGARLLRFVRERARERGYERVTIGVNNPFSYQAAYRAGLCFTGEESGLAELTLAWPGDRSQSRYQAGLDVFRERDLSSEETSFLADKRERDPPAVLSPPA
ncbi:GNAT family N-acetyltransferase [Haloarcula nitratireducens]|uniref:GNAT family N-acetyltransferase n=1 Tax=Haloarcula nitratireducens TaxID=2487749 RepID=A0AAW4P7D8_9EURY|nr:GNAT family N-acetyltransferase [Halomicroarcula nitratireducens]MBX0293799.1 GNAT family N-acetyltransferase [Halomicroarcula nitratireducens]